MGMVWGKSYRVCSHGLYIPTAGSLLYPSPAAGHRLYRDITVTAKKGGQVSVMIIGRKSSGQRAAARLVDGFSSALTGTVGRSGPWPWVSKRPSWIWWGNGWQK